MKSRLQKQSIRIQKEDLIDASSQMGIVPAQAEKLWSLLNANVKPGNLFNLSNTVWYLGVLVLFFALIFLGYQGYSTYGALGLFLISLFSALVLAAVGIYFWKVKSWQFWGGGILFLAMALVPIIAYSLLNFIGWSIDNPMEFFPDFHALIHDKWILMEVATILVTSATIYFIRFPPFSVLLYLSFWVMSLELIPSLVPKYASTINALEIPSIIFGVIAMLVAWIIDKRSKKDFAFWGYFFGSFSLWFSTTTVQYTTEWGYFGCCLVNILLIVFGSLLKRAALFVFGTLGILIYLVMLAYRHFSHSPLFFVILSLIGFSIIGMGVYLKKRGIYPGISKAVRGRKKR